MRGKPERHADILARQGLRLLWAKAQAEFALTEPVRLQRLRQAQEVPRVPVWRAADQARTSLS